MDFWWTNAQGKNHQITSIHPFNTPSCLEVVEISRAKLLAPFHRPSSAISEAVNGSSPVNGPCRWDVCTKPWGWIAQSLLDEAMVVF